jgi:hypothetical protein
MFRLARDRRVNGGRMVAEADAAALVVRMATLLKLEGKNPVITAENSVRLGWHAALMLAEFGVAGDPENDDD